MEKLLFGWWNSALSPNGKVRNKKETEDIKRDREIVWKFILDILSQNNADFLALGEVCEEDVSFFSEGLKNSDYEVISGVKSVSSRATFSSCFIYDKSKVEVDECHEMTLSSNNFGKLKIAQKLKLRSAFGEEQFIVFVSHWPSLRTESKNSPKRQTLAMRLRDLVNKELEGNAPTKSHIILMGDYNEEPYSDAIHEHLQASRDFEHVRNKRALLYNPLWRQMANTNWSSECAGTYFHKSGKITQWLNLDQVLVSSSLLGDSEWRYVLGQNSIAEIPEMLMFIKDRKENLDHLPIFCQLEKE